MEPSYFWHARRENVINNDNGYGFNCTKRGWHIKFITRSYVVQERSESFSLLSLFPFIKNLLFVFVIWYPYNFIWSNLSKLWSILLLKEETEINLIIGYWLCISWKIIVLCKGVEDGRILLFIIICFPQKSIFYLKFQFWM